MAFLASSTAGPPRLLRHGEMTPFQHYCAVRRSLPGVCDLDVMKIIVLGPETSLLEKLAHGRENELPTSSIRNLLLCCRTLAKLVTEAVQNIVIAPCRLSAIPSACRFNGDRHRKSVQYILRELPSAAHVYEQYFLTRDPMSLEIRMKALESQARELHKESGGSEAMKTIMFDWDTLTFKRQHVNVIRDVSIDVNYVNVNAFYFYFTPILVEIDVKDNLYVLPCSYSQKG